MTEEKSKFILADFKDKRELEEKKIFLAFELGQHKDFERTFSIF